MASVLQTMVPKKSLSEMMEDSKSEQLAYLSDRAPQITLLTTALAESMNESMEAAKKIQSDLAESRAAFGVLESSLQVCISRRSVDDGHRTLDSFHHRLAASRRQARPARKGCAYPHAHGDRRLLSRAGERRGER